MTIQRVIDVDPVHASLPPSGRFHVHKRLTPHHTLQSHPLPSLSQRRVIVHMLLHRFSGRVPGLRFGTPFVSPDTAPALGAVSATRDPLVTEPMRCETVSG